MKKNCPCLTGNWNKCHFPDGISIRKIQGFKDEPLTEHKECSFMLYIGAGSFYLSEFTRKEYEELMLKNTLCRHPMNTGE